MFITVLNNFEIMVLGEMSWKSVIRNDVIVFWFLIRVRFLIIWFQSHLNRAWINICHWNIVKCFWQTLFTCFEKCYKYLPDELSISPYIILMLILFIKRHLISYLKSSDAIELIRFFCLFFWFLLLKKLIKYFVGII